MRLVVACHSYHPAIGGVERLVQGLVEELSRRGVDATVVTRQDPGTAPEERIHGVRVIRLPMVRLGRFHIPRGYFRTLRELNPEVFHLSGNRVWCADFYLPRARRVEWPQVMTGHGFYQYEMGPRAWDRWYFERYLPARLRWFDLYTAITAHERDQLVSWGVDRGEIVMIPNGVSLEEFAEPRTDPAVVRAKWGFKAPLVAVYVGGFYENKRVDRLIRSIAATRGHWALVAVGRDLPGTAHDRASIARLASEMGAEVALFDLLPRTAVLDALNAADVAVLGSSYEGFGIFVLEAMAMGRPFVAFRTGAVPELAASGSGYCVDSEAEFAKALHDLEDPSIREGMGSRGKGVVRQYTVAEQATRFLQAYQLAVRRRAERSPGAQGSVLTS